jgi:hypothetical protein
MLTEIYLCHAWPCQEILRAETAGQGAALLRLQPGLGVAQLLRQARGAQAGHHRPDLLPRREVGHAAGPGNALPRAQLPGDVVSAPPRQPFFRTPAPRRRVDGESGAGQAWAGGVRLVGRGGDDKETHSVAGRIKQIARCRYQLAAASEEARQAWRVRAQHPCPARSRNLGQSQPLRRF